MARNPDGSWWQCHTSLKLSLAAAHAPWITGFNNFFKNLPLGFYIIQNNYIIFTAGCSCPFYLFCGVLLSVEAAAICDHRSGNVHQLDQYSYILSRITSFAKGIIL